MLGDRLKLARKKLGYSLRDLTAKLEGGVSAQAISKYERGIMKPAPEVLLALADALQVSVDFLMREQTVFLKKIRFRKVSGLAAKARERMNSEVEDMLQRHHEIERILGFAGRGGPERTVDLKPEQAEGFAEKIRKAWQLGIDPIPSMTSLLEDRGIKVLVHDLPDQISGMHCLADVAGENASIRAIIVNRRHNLERRRMSLAHELFHHLARCSTQADEEAAAARFAGAFLVPRRHLLAEIGKNRANFGYLEFIRLKHMYQVSAAAILMRLSSLGTISQSSLTRAFRTFARTWRKIEPEPLPDEDSSSNHELPGQFERLCIGALSEWLITIRKAEDLLQIPRDDIAIKVNGPRA